MGIDLFWFAYLQNTIERVRTKASDVMEKLWGPGGVFPGELPVSAPPSSWTESIAKWEQGGARMSKRVSVDSINSKLDELFKNRKM